MTKDRWVVTHAQELEAVIHGFDPYRLGRVVSVRLEFDEGEDVGAFTALLRLAYWTANPPGVFVELAFEGVRQMTLPELGSARFELAEMHVTDISDRGLEGIQREVTDHSSIPRFHVLCREVKVTGVFSQGGESASRLWPREPVA
jgi:hypothetical protein